VHQVFQRQLFPFPPSAANEPEPWRLIARRDNWNVEASDSVPIGFAADRMVAWVWLDGMEQEGAEAVVQARVSRNSTKWTSWLQLAWYGAAEARERGAKPDLKGAWAAAGEDSDGKVHIDEWVASPQARFRFAQLRIFLRGGVQLAGAGLSVLHNGGRPAAAEILPQGMSSIPFRSGLSHRSQYDVPDIGGGICSPNAVRNAALALLGEANVPPIEEVARRAFDTQADIHGNWARVAQAAHTLGLPLRLEYFNSLAPVFDHLRAGRLVVASIRWAEGELPGAPIAASKGHLCLVAGYDADKAEILCCDSAQPTDRPLPHAYPVEAFAQCWIGGSALGYVIG